MSWQIIDQHFTLVCILLTKNIKKVFPCRLLIMLRDISKKNILLGDQKTVYRLCTHQNCGGLDWKEETHCKCSAL
jgi:hypothetical protein